MWSSTNFRDASWMKYSLWQWALFNYSHLIESLTQILLFQSNFLELSASIAYILYVIIAFYLHLGITKKKVQKSKMTKEKPPQRLDLIQEANNAQDQSRSAYSYV